MELAVIGEGGHSKVIMDLIRFQNDKVKAVLDDKYTELVCHDDGIYRGPVASVPHLLRQIEHLKFIVAIGNNKVRKSIVTKLGFTKESYVSLIHPSAVVSPSAQIGQGAVIMAHCTINADAIIGNHTIINTGAIVEHDSRIEDYAHVAPHATLTGAVCVREGTMIGAAAAVIPGKTIGEWAVIGAGSTVISDIPSFSTAVGSPAKVLHCPNTI
ncbi:acetyltransferase [Paenibacillus sp. UNC451MF]|uniref:acetyltransferase n=1 Tax=Paenibacillus sp. UNC451MF TaxID=1449063 RepID=UPI00048E0E11|nr:acetyltransferase [Paenibacillus sp. UNC451MF]